MTVIISIFLEWGPEDFFDMSRSAAKIPTQLLWDTIPASLDSFPLMWPLLLAAVTMVLSTMRPKATIVGLIGSLLALAIPLLYVNAIRAVIADPLFADDVGVTDGVGIGTWICMAGAGLGILGSVGRILTGRRGSRSPN